MALKSTDGKYLRITNISFHDGYVANVSYDIFESEEHRINGDTEFTQRKSGSVNSGLLQKELAKLADPEKSVEDNFKTRAYTAIKGDTFEISSWTDA